MVRKGSPVRVRQRALAKSLRCGDFLPGLPSGANELFSQRFPDGTYTDVTGLCRAATLAEIEEQGWGLDPGATSAPRSRISTTRSSRRNCSNADPHTHVRVAHRL